jgi:hypothetical protein
MALCAHAVDDRKEVSGTASIMADSTMTAASDDAVVTKGDTAVYIEQGKANRYDDHVHRYRKYWSSLIPTQFIVQNAGNMGLISVGTGWDYGKHRQWETHFLIGYIPKYKSPRGKVTFTLKQTYTPWSITLKNGMSFLPLSTGLYFNTVAGSEFWDKQPGRYPDKYYDFLSTKVRINVFVGQGISKEIPKNSRKFVKSATLFYEVSTCDLYVRAAFLDDKVRISDILGLSLGLKLLIL